MWNSFIGGMTGGFAGVLDFFVQIVQSMFTFNLSFFANNFPVITTLYTIIQGVGIGLAIAIAIFQLMKYFWGPLADVKTTPLEIAVRLLISIGLIWVGNYLLEGIINLFSYPYVRLMNVDVNAAASADASTFTAAVTAIGTLSAAMTPVGSNVIGAGGMVSLLLSLIAIIVVGWNTCKLLLEVVERFLMVGVLTYASPLAWATITSRNTFSIFQKYFSMFMGQCLLMLLNVWSVKMLLSIMHYESANILLRFVVALAFCKIAQRFDSYLQALGINAAHTGGSLLEDIAAVAMGAAGITSKFGGSMIKGMGGKALGETLTKTGFLGTAGYAIGSGIGKTREGISDAVSSAKAGIGLSTNDNATYSRLFRKYNGAENPDGTISLTDSRGDVHTAKNSEDAFKKMLGFEGSAPKFVGETSIAKDKDGMYHWTDANGKSYHSKNLNDIYSYQTQARTQYSGTADYYPGISQRDDGKFEWTDKNGNKHVADTQMEAERGRAAAYANSNVQSRVSPNDNLRNMNVAKSQTDGYAPIVKTADGKYEWTDKNGGVWKSDSYEDAKITKQTVINGYNSQGNVSPNTNLKGSEAAISHQAAMSTYNNVYSNDSGKNMMETIAPGITSAMAGDTSAGVISNLKYENGEMSGVYASVGEDGSVDMVQSFSIRDEASFNSLSEGEKAEYVDQSFVGADGNTYYFDAKEADMSTYDTTSNIQEAQVETSSIQPDTETIQTEGNSVHEEAHIIDTPSNVPVSSSTVEATSGEKFYQNEKTVEVSGVEKTSNTVNISDAKVISEQEKGVTNVSIQQNIGENNTPKEKFIQNSPKVGIDKIPQNDKHNKKK